MPQRPAARPPSRPVRALAAALAALALAAPAAAQNGRAFDTNPDPDIVTSHGVSAFGDLKYPPDFEHYAFVNPDAPKGGRWSGRGAGASNTFDSLNPFILKGEPAQALSATFDSLLAGSPEEADAAYGLVARTVTYPEDRGWAEFEIREEAVFHDGTPILAEDVVWTYETLKEKGAPVYRIRLRNVSKAEAVDERRVRFTFDGGPANRDLPMLVGGLPILSKDWWAQEGRDFEDSTLDPILGSGPYRVKEAEPGRRIVYERVPDYWGRNLPVNVGANNFDEYIFEYFKDYTAAFEAFKGGAFLFHQEFFSKIWATEYDFPALEKGWVVKAQIPDNRPAGTQGFWFNMRRDQFQDPRVREALAMGFDFEWSNDTLFYGLYDRTVSFFQNSPMMAEGMPSEAELALLEPLREHIPETVFTEPAYTPPETNASGSDRRVLRRAMRLLDQAGWTVGDDGLRRNADGEVLTVEFLDDSPTFQRIIGPYVQNLKKMGVDASLRVVDAAQYQARQEDFDYDVVPGRFVMSLTPGTELRSLFGSEAADQRGTPNLSGVANPAVDALIEKAIAADSREELTVTVKALDRVLRALHVWTPNWYGGFYNVAYWDVFGKPDTPPPYSRGDGYWWWDADKAEALKADGAPI